MPIQGSDFHVFKSALISNTPAQNGGRMSAVESLTNTKGNLFPDITQSQRVSGVTLVRKRFEKIHTDPAIELVNARAFISTPSTGDDYSLLLHTGSHTDTEDQIPGNQRHFGLGTLKTGVSLGATQLVITLEHAGMAASGLQPFKPGDTLWISNQGSSIHNAGNSEFLTVGPNAGDVSYSGGDVTLNLTVGTTFAWTAGAYVSSVITVASVKPTWTNLVVTSSAGAFTESNNIVLNGFGAIQQNWTITLTNSVTGAFRLDGDALGTGVATGTMGSDFSPNHPDFSKPYFKIKSTAWSGTWANNDTLTFTTGPAAIPLWHKLIVPAGAASISNTGCNVAVIGESA
ncbi:MAG: hypothetical protein HQL51_01660 [Magnetococcales bacterium]|nr:hypothetical protein [Magnetococcales bacterium]